MTEIKIGDVVRLKSGGPKMTVFSWPGYGEKCYYCVWFVEGELKDDKFHPDTLEVVDE